MLQKVFFVIGCHAVAITIVLIATEIYDMFSGELCDSICPETEKIIEEIIEDCVV